MMGSTGEHDGVYRGTQVTLSQLQLQENTYFDSVAHPHTPNSLSRGRGQQVGGGASKLGEKKDEHKVC